MLSAYSLLPYCMILKWFLVQINPLEISKIESLSDWNCLFCCKLKSEPLNLKKYLISCLYCNDCYCVYTEPDTGGDVSPGIPQPGQSPPHRGAGPPELSGESEPECPLLSGRTKPRPATRPPGPRSVLNSCTIKSCCLICKGDPPSLSLSLKRNNCNSTLVSSWCTVKPCCFKHSLD